MPTSKRDLIKRKHTAIENALDRSMVWTQELHDMFLEYHPEYSKGYLNIFIALDQVKTFITEMKGFI